MRLSSLLEPRRIRCGLTARTRDEALRELVDLIANTNDDILPDDILVALDDREKQGPFSMSKGAAFPHARTEKVSDFTIALGTSRDGIDFKSPDGKPVRIVVLFVIPKKHSNLYLHTLAAFLSFFQVTDHVDRILEATDGAELITLIDSLAPLSDNNRAGRLPYRPVLPLRLDTPLDKALVQFDRSGLQSLPVVDDVGDLLGEVVAEPLRESAATARAKNTTPLSGFPDLLVRSRLSTGPEEETPDEASRRLRESGSPFAYVLRGRRLLGRIALQDLPPS